MSLIESKLGWMCVFYFFVVMVRHQQDFHTRMNEHFGSRAPTGDSFYVFCRHRAASSSSFPYWSERYAACCWRDGPGATSCENVASPIGTSPQRWVLAMLSCLNNWSWSAWKGNEKNFKGTRPSQNVYTVSFRLEINVQNHPMGT